MWRRIKGINLSRVCLFALLAALFISCEDEHAIPKPVGYFRIDLPDHNYVDKEFGCPFTFPISTQSRLVFYEESKDNCWFNIEYPELHATLHVTYKPIDNNLRDYLEEARALTYEHQVKAQKITPTLINNSEKKVYGLTYDLGGKVASPYQFYLTDSVNHFLRGSLYFEARPNPDSLKPSLAFVRQDLQVFTDSFSWISED